MWLVVFKVVCSVITLLFVQSNFFRCLSGQKICLENMLVLASSITGLIWAFGLFN